MNFIAFLNDETGAVTVDWVVLTAAVVTLGLVVFKGTSIFDHFCWHAALAAA